MLLRLLVVLALLVLGVAPAKARVGVTFDVDAETFLRKQLLAGKDVDLNAHCGPFAPQSIRDLGRTERCRTMSGDAFARVLRDKAIAQALPANGFVITGLYVKDDVALGATDIAANLVCRSCLFGGKLGLEGARLGRGLRLEGSELVAGLDARAAQVNGRVSLIRTTFRDGSVDLSTATVADMLETDGARFDAESRLDLSQAKIGIVRLTASDFAGGLRADDATIAGTVTLDGATRIGGDGFVARAIGVGSYFKIGGKSDIVGLDLTGAHLKAGFEIAGGEPGAADKIGGGARIGSAIAVPGDAHPGPAGLVLVNATVDGVLAIDEASVVGQVVADGASIGKGLSSRRTRYENAVSLNRVDVGGDVAIDAGEMKSWLVGQKLQVAGSFYLRKETTRDLDLRGARIGADAEFADAAIDGKLALDQASIGKHLDFEGDTRLTAPATFAGVAMNDLLIGTDARTGPTLVRFDEADFSLVKVSGSVFMHKVAFAKPLLLVAADIKGHLDITAAELDELDMTRAWVGGDFRLAEREAPHAVAAWRPEATLKLKNAHVGIIQDESGMAQGRAWPEKIDLQGFGYDHFGNLPTLDWAWGWLDSGPFGPEPFMRLAKYYTDEGHKELGDQVLYRAKQKEKSAAWSNCAQGNSGSCAHAIGLTALWALIGYGIGNGLFQAFIWVGVLTGVGALVLRRTRGANQQSVLWGGPGRGRLWCVGASANHLIPLVELSREFKDFFDDPKRDRLRPWQLIYFGAHAVMGYVLASFVVAAIAGLTQSH